MGDPHDAGRGAELHQHADGRTTDMRVRILEAAHRLFAVHGFAATSLRDIAEQLGVSKAALYYHFPKKADLVHDVLAPMVDDIDGWFDVAEQSDLPPRALLTDYFDVVYRHRDLIAAVGREPAAIDLPDLVVRMTRWVERAQTVLTGPEATLEQRIRATVAIAGLARCTGFFPSAPIDALRTHTVEAALDALGPVPRSPPT